MAQRLRFDERARVEAMSAAGVSVATAARCLGRHRSTVHRELRRGRRDGAYDAEAAQAAAAVGAARPKTPVLAADPELAASVRELLKEGWSPHAICAALRAEGRTVSAETIYRAAYDHSGSSGLPEGSWRCLPSRRDTLPVNVVTLGAGPERRHSDRKLEPQLSAMTVRGPAANTPRRQQSQRRLALVAAA